MESSHRKPVRGEHCLNVFVSCELKEQLKSLAKRYDRTVAGMVRSILIIGIPVMEGLSEAEGKMIREYIRLFRKFRKMKDIKDL